MAVLTQEMIPPALIGTPPSWWPNDAGPVLAFGPFAVQTMDGQVKIARLLRWSVLGPNLLLWEDDDHGWLLEIEGRPVVRGETLALRGVERSVVFRPVAESDARWIRITDDGQGALMDRIRRAWRW